MDRLVVEELPLIFAAYLKAADKDEKQRLVAAHPQIFSDEIIAALTEARQQITASLKETQDAFRLIDGVAGVMDLPGNGSELVKVQESERRTVIDENMIVDHFAQILAQLLPQMPSAATERAASTALPASTALAALDSVESTVACGTVTHGAIEGDATVVSWFQQPALVFEVLSYLPCEEVLMHCENVCRDWYLWLCVPANSRFFWVGCVQREFPILLQQLILTEGGDLFESDWRTIAMLCVTEAAESADEDITDGEDSR